LVDLVDLVGSLATCFGGLCDSMFNDLKRL